MPEPKRTFGKSKATYGKSAAGRRNDRHSRNLWADAASSPPRSSSQSSSSSESRIKSEKEPLRVLEESPKLVPFPKRMQPVQEGVELSPSSSQLLAEMNVMPAKMTLGEEIIEPSQPTDLNSAPTVGSGRSNSKDMKSRRQKISIKSITIDDLVEGAQQLSVDEPLLASSDKENSQSSRPSRRRKSTAKSVLSERSDQASDISLSKRTRRISSVKSSSDQSTPERPLRGLRKRAKSASVSPPASDSALKSGKDCGVEVYEDAEATGKPATISENREEEEKADSGSDFSTATKGSEMKKAVHTRFPSEEPEEGKTVPEIYGLQDFGTESEEWKKSVPGSDISSPPQSPSQNPHGFDSAPISLLSGSSLAPELSELLSLCTIPEIIDFTAYIESLLVNSNITKLGEASFSEVFLHSPGPYHPSTSEIPAPPAPPASATTVLKVIPFGSHLEEQTLLTSILQEVRITSTMGSIPGFIGFRGATICKGYFPDYLQWAWNEYRDDWGTENPSPVGYSEDQMWAVIALENGGTSLENFELNGWEEAADVFWQCAATLALGEKEQEFEHRDLHWGNLVIQRGDEGLKVSLIDYTLSRARVGEGQYEFLPLTDPGLFTGEDEYQFDIYRYMREHLVELTRASSSSSSDLEAAFDTLTLDTNTHAASSSQGSAESFPLEEINWNLYAPATNVYWLSYILDILTTQMVLSKPKSAKGSSRRAREWRAWKGLQKAIEVVDDGVCGEMGSAGDVVAWGKKAGLL